MLLYSYKEISFHKHRLMTLLLLSTIISMTMSIMLWNQSGLATIKAFRTYYLVLIFYVLCKRKADTGEVEKALVLLAILYLVCWMYQISQVPDLVFGNDQSGDLANTESRGFYRFWIPTKENMPILALFMYELFRRTKKNVFLILMPVCFIIVILHVGRQMIFWSFVSIVLLLIYNYRKRWLTLTISTVALYYVSILLINNIDTIDLLSQMTTSQVQYANDDIRTKCMEFFWQQSTSNPIGFLFGNGVAWGGNNEAFASFIRNAQYKGYYLSDIGYVSLLYNFGILGVIVYIALFIKMMKLKVEDKYIYLKFYMIYIYGSYTFAHSLTTNIFFNMCVFYILYASNRQLLRYGEQKQPKECLTSIIN